MANVTYVVFAVCPWKVNNQNPIDTTNIIINSESKNVTVEGFESFSIENLKGIIGDNVVTDNSGKPLTKLFYYYDSEKGVDGEDIS